VRNPIRNETSLVLAVAVIFSGVAIPVLSGFLEPSQPPAVATVQIGDPRDRDSGADDESVPSRQVETDEGGPAGDAQSRSSAQSRARSAQSRARSAQSRAREHPTQPAPSVPADDAEDDRGEAD
jgi:hypothetical protein